MDAFAIAIVGIISSLLLGVAGLHYTAKARTASMRETLFGEQVRLAVQVLTTLGAIRNYSAVLTDPTTRKQFPQARPDLAAAMADLSEATEVAAAICPVEIYVELSRLRRLVVALSDAIDEEATTESLIEEFAGHSAKIGLMFRTYLGVDELSHEATEILGVSKNAQSLTDLRPNDIVQAVRSDK